MITIKAKSIHDDFFFDDSKTDLSEIRKEEQYTCEIEAHNAKALDYFSVSRLSNKVSNKLKMLPFELRSTLAAEVIKGHNSITDYESLITKCGDIFNYPSDIAKGIDKLISKHLKRHDVDSAIKYAEKKKTQLKKCFSFPVDWKVISTPVKRSIFADKQAGIAMGLLKNVEGKTYRDAVLSMIDSLSAFQWGVCSFDVTCDPMDEKYLVQISYFIDSSWWRKKIDRAYLSACESARRIAGLVGENDSVYASVAAIDWYKQKQVQTEKWLKTIVMTNSDNQSISMFDVHQASLANPENRRNELMLRINAMESLAKERGLLGVFITMTTPSRFHSMKKHGKYYIENEKFDGSSVRDGQEWLKGRWSLIRTAWNDRGIKPLGLRVAEPHKDGTVHWHMLLFINPELKQIALSIFEKYMYCQNRYPRQYQEDRNELKTVNQFKARFLAKDIDPTKGSAAAYVAKYISKNINAKAVEKLEEKESGKKLHSLVNNVNAWCRLASIRQFQMFGMPSVTIWRELRRLRDNQDYSEIMQLFRQAAGIQDTEYKADFLKYIKLGEQYGFPNLVKGITEDLRGTTVETIVGIEFGLSFIQTHFHGEWLKGKASKEVTKAIEDRFNAAARGDSEAVYDALYALDLALACEGVERPSWTSGNNCRIPQKTIVNGVEFTFEDAIKANRERMAMFENEEIVYFEFED